MKTPWWWHNENTLAKILAPVGEIYAFVTMRRLKEKPSYKAPIPVICIGNIVAGGGGKTPVAIAIGAALKARNIKVFFVSKGYGGNISSAKIVNKDSSAQEVGDEPLLLAKHLPTIVGKNRPEAINLALENGAELVILDDGMQSQDVEKTSNVLVLKGKNPFGNSKFIPAGPLRESFENGVKRAKAIVVIDGALDLTCHKISIFYAKTSLNIPHGLNKVVAFSGIAQPELFFSSLKESGLDLVYSQAFADHHQYKKSEIDKLIMIAKKSNAPLVTTEKDWVRLSEESKKLVLIITQEIKIENLEPLLELLKEKQ